MRQYFLFFAAILWLSFFCIDAKRKNLIPKQRIVLKKAECGDDKELVDLSKCEVQVHSNRTGAYCSGTFTTNITSFGLEAMIYTKRYNEMKVLMDISDVDVCSIIHGGKTSAPIIRFFRDMLDSGGNIPKRCPIQKGYQFEFKDLNLDPKFFPFLPDMNFLLVLNFGLNEIPRNFVVNVTGEIINYRRSLSVG